MSRARRRERVLTALEEVVFEEISNAQKVKIGSIVQFTVRLKPATKARQGRNPATGEEITIAAKPASVTSWSCFAIAQPSSRSWRSSCCRISRRYFVGRQIVRS
jgi:nucleoid DNA-binding protein